MWVISSENLAGGGAGISYSSSSEPAHCSTVPALRVCMGAQFAGRAKKSAPLILHDFLEKASGRPIELVSTYENADLVLASVLDLRERFERDRRKFLAPKDLSLSLSASRYSQGLPILVVSFENLQHPWWAEFGGLLLSSRIPRTSFFPTSVDPGGARFPYWWNYLDWPTFSRPLADYRRYGRLYSMENLMEPVPLPDGRLVRACFIGSGEQTEPRRGILRWVDNEIGLDVFGGAGKAFSGPKLPLMSKYKYAVAAENSFGLGYDSEKLPEAWDAGCVPVGAFQQPFSDFNPLAIGVGPNLGSTRHPLLLRPPDPTPLLEYLAARVL